MTSEGIVKQFKFWMMGDERMVTLIRGQHRIVLGLVLVMLALAACSNVNGETTTGENAVPPQDQTPTSVILDESELPSPDEPGFYRIINVTISEDGAKPSRLFIPVGERIQLVVRNRDTTEHHYRIVGLIPYGLEWIAPEGDEPIFDETATEAEIEAASHHHGTGFIPFRAESPSGIRPIGDEVHAWVSGRGSAVDQVRFIATNTGTFIVECPLHSEEIGKVTVF